MSENYEGCMLRCLKTLAELSIEADWKPHRLANEVIKAVKMHDESLVFWREYFNEQDRRRSG